MAELPPLQFAAVGLNHSHIYGMTRALLDAGAQLVSFFTQTDALAHPFAQAFPQAARRASITEVLEDPEVALIVSAAVPCERAPLGLEAMRHGKDFLSDKPGFITPEQLAAAKRAHADTGRRYLVYFSERFESRATTKAGALVAEGAIGEVVHMIGLGPHQIGLFPRPAWFYDPSQSGGILTDLASHQIDQFLFFSASSGADLLSATVANRAHPAHASFRDVGDVTLQNGAASGFIRVDWLTPDGLGRWGDGRLFLVGTEGTLEAASGCRVFPIFQYRFGHGLQKLKSLVDQGVTGRAFTTTVETAWRRRADYYQVPWRGKWASELGGALISHALHAHDMLSYILGPVRRVAAFTATRVNPIEVEDCASVSLELADGSLASLTVTLGSAAEISRHRFCFENLVAESGTDPYRSSSEPWTFTPDTAEQAVRVEKTLARFSPQPEGYEGQFYRVYEALRRGAPAPVTLHDARTALELATAIYEAAETGTVVSLPLNEQHPRYATWQPASLRKPGQNLGQRPGQNLGSTKTEAW